MPNVDSLKETKKIQNLKIAAHETCWREATQFATLATSTPGSAPPPA